MATEKRLIDANACPCIKCDRLGNCRPGLCEVFAEWWLSPMEAQEVVRCKDCKHYKPMKPYPSYNGQTNYCCRSASVRVVDNDFCSKGERKDNG